MRFPWVHRDRHPALECDAAIVNLNRNLMEVELLLITAYRGFAERLGCDFNEVEYRVEFRAHCDSLKSDVIQKLANDSIANKGE